MQQKGKELVLKGKGKKGPAEIMALFGKGKGGFAEKVVVQWKYAFPVPDTLEPEYLGPLMVRRITKGRGLRRPR